MAPILCALAVALLLQGTHATDWAPSSPQVGSTLYACVNTDVTFPWNYALTGSDVLGDIQWYFNGQSQELMAMSAHGAFVPLPTFANRVAAVGNAGVSLTQVTEADTGNYTVEVHVYGDNGASHSPLHGSVFLQVTDQLMTQDGALHADQHDEAVLDSSSGKWSIQLRCGYFTFRGEPPVYVEWVIPSGDVVNSTDYNDGHFNLLLSPPLQGGNYTCRIPAHLTDDVCLQDSSSHLGVASVVVDKMEARLSLLEKENSVLKEQLRQVGVDQAIQLANIVQQHTVQLEDLQSRMQLSECQYEQPVAFHARDLHDQSTPNYTPLKMRDIEYNIGNGYDNVTGYFNAPFDGIYLFIATTGGTTQNDDAFHFLYVDNVEVDRGYTHHDSNGDGELATVHAVLHLNQGQRVWVMSGGDAYLSEASSFSGVLLHRDCGAVQAGP